LGCSFSHVKRILIRGS